MSLRSAIEKVIQSAAAQATAGDTKTFTSEFTAAVSAVSGIQAVESASQRLSIDCKYYLAAAAFSLGIARGLGERLQAHTKKEFSKTIPQTEAFPLVDLWGRVLGIEVLLLDLTTTVEQAAFVSAQKQTVARAASVLVLEEGVLRDLASEFAHRSRSVDAGVWLDSAATLLRSELLTPVRAALSEYVHQLPV